MNVEFTVKKYKKHDGSVCLSYSSLLATGGFKTLGEIVNPFDASAICQNSLHHICKILCTAVSWRLM